MEKKNNVLIRDYEEVKMIVSGKYGEVYNVGIFPKKPKVKKAKNGFHIHTETGELIKDKPYSSRGDNPINLRKSLNALRRVIETNAEDCRKIRLLTLSCKEKQSDCKIFYTHLKKFFKKLNSVCGEFGNIEYIAAPELYADLTGYHLNVICFFEKAPTKKHPPIQELQKMWTHGDLSIRYPKSVKAISNYVTPHRIIKVTQENKKMHDKAERLMIFSPGKKLYTCSKGIKRPSIKRCLYSEAKKSLEEDGYSYKSGILIPIPVENTLGPPLIMKKQFFEKATEKPKHNQRENKWNYQK